MKKSNHIHTAEDSVIDIINTVIMCMVIAITVFPFYLIIVKSFNEGVDSNIGGLLLYPRKFTLDNYITFFSKSEWLYAFKITSLRTAVGSISSVLFTCVAAYGLSREELLFRKLYFRFIIITMYFSGGIIPYYILLRSLGLLNSFAVYIIPSLLNTFFLMIAVSFFRDYPHEVIESAHIDGANDLVIFIRIILPTSLPLIAAMLLFIGVNQWNAWVDSAYYVKNSELRTLSYRLREVINQSTASLNSQAVEYARNATQTTPQSLQMAAIVISTVPIMCVYPFLQKYFIKGMMVGAVKG